MLETSLGTTICKQVSVTVIRREFNVRLRLILMHEERKSILWRSTEVSRTQNDMGVNFITKAQLRLYSPGIC